MSYVIDDAPDSERTQRADHLMEMAKDDRLRAEPDPFRPPPGAQEWLAACILFWVHQNTGALRTQVPGFEARGDRAFGLIGALEHHAQLTPAQSGRLNHWLWPSAYDERGRVIPPAPPPAR